MRSGLRYKVKYYPHADDGFLLILAHPRRKGLQCSRYAQGLGTSQLLTEGRPEMPGIAQGQVQPLTCYGMKSMGGIASQKKA